MRQKLFAAGPLVAVAVAIAAPSRAEAPRDRQPEARRFTLVAPATEQTSVDLGRRGPSQGDLFVFGGPLRERGGATRGRLDGHCVTVSVPSRTDREQDRRQCFVTSTIGDAEIQATGVGRILAEDVLFSVTGGTLRFKRVSGQALVDYTRPDQVTIDYELYLRP